MKRIESPQLRSPLRSLFRLLELLDPSLIPTQQAGEFFDGAFGPSSSTIVCAGSPNSREAGDAPVGAEMLQEVDGDRENTCRRSETG